MLKTRLTVRSPVALCESRGRKLESEALSNGIIKQKTGRYFVLFSWSLICVNIFCPTCVVIISFQFWFEIGMKTNRDNLYTGCFSISFHCTFEKTNQNCSNFLYDSSFIRNAVQFLIISEDDIIILFLMRLFAVFFIPQIKKYIRLVMDIFP